MSAWERWAPVVLLVGATSWLAKMGVIVATDGRVDSTGAAAVFFIGGILLMAVGATAVGLWLSRGRAVWIRSVSILISFLAFFVSFVILDGIAKPTLGEVGPSYMSDEAGILVTAIVWLFIAAALLRTRPAELRRLEVPGSLTPSSSGFQASQ